MYKHPPPPPSHLHTCGNTVERPMNPGIISPERSSDSTEFRFWLHIPHIIWRFSSLPLDVPYTLPYCTRLILIALVVSERFDSKIRVMILIHLMLTWRQRSHISNHPKSKNKNQCLPSSPYLKYTFFFPIVWRVMRFTKIVWEGLSRSYALGTICFTSSTAFLPEIFYLHCYLQRTVNNLQRIKKTPLSQ